MNLNSIRQITSHYVRDISSISVVQKTDYFIKEIANVVAAGGLVAPSNQPTLLTFTSVTSSGYTVSWTASVGGADGYVVFRRTGASPTYTPIDGTTYVVDTVYGDSTCEYFGSAVTFNESGLSQLTTYYYDVFAYNGTTGTYKFLTTSPLEGSQQTSFAFENAIRFNGTNGRINLTDTALFNGQTAAAFLFWMKQDASVTGATQYVITKQKSGANREGIRVGITATDKLIVLVPNSAGTGNVTWIGNSSMSSPTAWHHIAIFINMTAGTCIMYVDNASYANAKTGTNAATFGTFTTHAGVLGCYKNESLSSSAFFDGVIDDMVVYHSADETLRTAHYGSGNGGAPSGSPYSHWKFDESNPTTPTQDAIANNDGDLINFGFTLDGYEAH